MSELLKDNPNILKLKGKEYEIPKLTYPLLESIESKFGTGLVTLALEITSTKSLTRAIELLCFILKDLKPEDFTGRVDMNDVSNIFQSILTFLNGE
jgi:hypothetical protein